MIVRPALRASWLGGHPTVLLAIAIAALIVVSVLAHLSVRNDIRAALERAAR